MHKHKHGVNMTGHDYKKENSLEEKKKSCVGNVSALRAQMQIEKCSHSVVNCVKISEYNKSVSSVAAGQLSLLLCVTF